MTGSVKVWKTEQGWGFITGDDGNDYFVHHSTAGWRLPMSSPSDDEVVDPLGTEAVLDALEKWGAERDQFQTVLRDVTDDDLIERDDKYIEMCARLEMELVEPTIFGGHGRCSFCRLAIDMTEEQAHKRWHVRMQAANAISTRCADLALRGVILTGGVIGSGLADLIDIHNAKQPPAPPTP